MAATAADPERLRKSRRENPLMATLPHLIFYGAMMRRELAFRKQARARPRPAHAKMGDGDAGLAVGAAFGCAASIEGRRAQNGRHPNILATTLGLCSVKPRSPAVSFDHTVGTKQDRG